MHNVVALRPKYSDLEQLRVACYLEIRKLHFAERVPMKVLAKWAGCAPSTLSKFIYGETQYPRFQTVMGIAAACGFTLTWGKP